MQKPRTVDQIRRQLEAEVKAKVKEVSQKKRQAVLDLLREGKTIGEVRDALNLDQDVVCEIINQNISDYKYLRDVAL